MIFAPKPQSPLRETFAGNFQKDTVLRKKMRNAIIGNVGTIITFRLGSKDAGLMAQEFYPTFKKDDFINLPRFHIYLKLLIDGVGSKGFSAVIPLV